MNGNTDEETKLLFAARNGDVLEVRDIVERRVDGNVDLNCTGKQKANRGWTSLHLASYFGHSAVVKLLIESGADLNCTNAMGETPLHRASFTGREAAAVDVPYIPVHHSGCLLVRHRLDIVMLLIQHGIDVNIVNLEGLTAAQLAKTASIKNLIQAAEQTDQRQREESFLKAALDGNEATLTELLKSCRVLNVNCTDLFGNTALHLAAMRGRKSLVVVLLQAGVDHSLRNMRGLTAYEMTSDTQLKMLLDVVLNQQVRTEIHRHEGLLFKRVRLLGWRPCWVVLERGVLSVFSSRADSTTGSNRKSYKYLNGAKFVERVEVSHLLTIKLIDGKLISFSVGNDPSSLITQQKWETAIKKHIVYCSRLSGNVIDEDNDDEILPLGTLQDELKTAQAHQQVLEKLINSSLNQFTYKNGFSESHEGVEPTNERVLLKLMESSRHMSEALSKCLTLFIQQEQFRRLELEQERDKSRILQESLRIIAQENLSLERSITTAANFQSLSVKSIITRPCRTSSDAGSSVAVDEFFECESDADSVSEEFGSVTSDNQSNLLNSTVATYNESLETAEERKLAPSSHAAIDLGTSIWGGRCRLPATISVRNFSVWSILKQCIGRELSKITMPVVFNEPLSFLQRMTEYMEYAELLKKAANCEDPIERHELVTAFAVSATASNWDRLGKPFNPLLGETFEFDRYTDLGYRMVCEQVSHHPPVSAFHVESPDFTYHGEIEPKIKFWGKSVEVTPKGVVTLHLKRHQETYTWQYSNCSIHNIIVGKIWIEHTGVMEIVNQKTKIKSVINFKPSGWFGGDIHKLDGVLYDDKLKRRAFYGKWTDALYSCDLKLYEESLLNTSKESSSNASLDQDGSSIAFNADVTRDSQSSNCDGVQTEHASTLSARSDERLVIDLRIAGQKLLWKATLKPADTHLYYYFTLYAMTLNEINELQRAILPPTDSRLRPDIRAMENGDIDRAADEKNRLEEKQRAVRKARGGDSSWRPRWFKQVRNAFTGSNEWTFTNDYWTRNWSQCEDIF